MTGHHSTSAPARTRGPLFLQSACRIKNGISFHLPLLWLLVKYLFFFAYWPFGLTFLLADCGKKDQEDVFWVSGCFPPGCPAGATFCRKPPGCPGTAGLGLQLPAADRQLRGTYLPTWHVYTGSCRTLRGTSPMLPVGLRASSEGSSHGGLGPLMTSP